MADLPLPLSRTAECDDCGTDLHVCRQCEFYDPRVSKACREPVAEEVNVKDRANFCGYFKAKPGAYKPSDDSQSRTAKSELDALFGIGADQDASTDGVTYSETNAARDKLERLFDDGNKKE